MLLEHLDGLRVVAASAPDGVAPAPGRRFARALSTSPPPPGVRLSDRTPARQRLPQRGDRTLVLTGEMALERPVVEQLGALARRKSGTEAQRTGVLRGSLAMRSDRGGTLGRSWRELQYRRRVLCRLGMVRQPRQIAPSARRVAQRLQDGAVQAGAPVGVDRLLDRHPRQLVPERTGPVGAQHAGREALLQARRARPRAIASSSDALGALGQDRHGVQKVRARVPSRAVRESTASRIVAGTSLRPRRAPR